MKLNRERVITTCLTLLNDKRNEFTAAILQVNEAIAGEQKSTAGDKHEVSKAILQAEQEKLYGQLQALDEQITDVQRLQTGSSTERIKNGSLVLTNHGYFFIGCALGKITVDHETVICLSGNAPLAKVLSGQLVTAQLMFNNLNYTIVSLM